MAMNRATPKYQATGVSSGQEAPKIASLSPTVVCSSHPPRSANGLHTGVRACVCKVWHIKFFFTAFK